MESSLEKLNLGSGNDYRSGWVNLDNGDCKKDVDWDLNNTPLPFDSNHFEAIDAIQVLEHIQKSNFFTLIRELYRISKPGARWNIAAPHGHSDNFITDPTHNMPFSTRTFDYLIEDAQVRENGLIYGLGDVFLKHHRQPTIDGNQSVIFHLEVVKHG